MRYYSTQRPVAPGGYPRPKGNPIKEIWNYDSREYRPEVCRRAWGYIEYEKPLTQHDCDSYELVAALPETPTKAECEPVHTDSSARANQVKIADDGKSLCVGSSVLYANDLNHVELLTPYGWKEALLEFDDNKGWVATTEMYSEEDGFCVSTLNVSPVGMFARIPRS